MWLYIVIGLIGGVLSGMGMGGGTILIPLATTFLSVKQIVAQGVNLFSFIPMAIVSIIIHIKNKLVCVKIGYISILFAIGTTVIGALIANKIDNTLLRKLFGVFLLVIGILQIVGCVNTKKVTNLKSDDCKSKLKIHIWHN